MSSEKIENGELDNRELAFKACQFAEDKKAFDIEMLDITDISDIADFVVICSGESKAQLKAIAASVEDSLSKLGIEPSMKEGKSGDKWFLLDYTDVIIHIIEDEAREFYNLDELWAKALYIPREEWMEQLKNLA